MCSDSFAFLLLYFFFLYFFCWHFFFLSSLSFRLSVVWLDLFDLFDCEQCAVFVMLYWVKLCAYPCMLSLNLALLEMVHGTPTSQPTSQPTNQPSNPIELCTYFDDNAYSFIFHVFASDVEIEYVNSFFSHFSFSSFCYEFFRFVFLFFGFCFSFVLFQHSTLKPNRILVLTIPFQSISFGFLLFLRCNIVFCYSASSIECIMYVSAHASNRNCISVVLVRRISLHKHKMYLVQKYNIF